MDYPLPYLKHSRYSVIDFGMISQFSKMTLGQECTPEVEKGFAGQRGTFHEEQTPWGKQTPQEVLKINHW